MSRCRKIIMTALGAVCLVLFSPLLLLCAGLIALWLLIRTLVFYPRFRKSGFPGKFSSWLAKAPVFNAFCALSAEKRADCVYCPGDLPLLRLADGTEIAAPDALLFYRLTEENSGTIGVPGEWVVDVAGVPPVNLSVFFREAEGKGLRPVVVTPEQPEVLPEDADAFRADTRLVPLSKLHDVI